MKKRQSICLKSDQSDKCQSGKHLQFENIGGQPNGGASFVCAGNTAAGNHNQAFTPSGAERHLPHQREARLDHMMVGDLEFSNLSNGIICALSGCLRLTGAI
jgi:hypothetical protein